MKVESVASFKGSRVGNRKTRKDPADGTALRKLYDLFYRNKGKVITHVFTSQSYGALNQLRDFYGLDIRKIAQRKWCLVGEWFGKDYIDYLVNKTDNQP